MPYINIRKAYKNGITSLQLKDHRKEVTEKTEFTSDEYPTSLTGGELRKYFGFSNVEVDTVLAHEEFPNWPAKFSLTTENKYYDLLHRNVVEKPNDIIFVVEEADYRNKECVTRSILAAFKTEKSAEVYAQKMKSDYTYLDFSVNKVLIYR